MGSCSVWDIDTSCCDLPETATEEMIERWQAVATDILWAAGGRRHGLCEVTVRPCLRRCGGGALPVPYKGIDGEWRNFATCGCVGECSCTELCEVVLPGPVASIVQVLIDGVELMSEHYRLDRVGTGYRLLRTDGECWPSCSDLNAACDEEGAFCVTYMQGIELDALGTEAISQATCELVKSCIPGCKTCKLPANVVSLVRRGVSMNFEQIRTAVLALPMVAAWVQAVNPNGLTSASTVWSPDIPRTRTTIATEVS